MAQLVETTELAAVTPAPGIERRALAGGALTLAVFLIEPGRRLPAHSHPHEQMGYVIEGRVRLTTPTGERELGPGAMYHFQGGEEHSVEVVSEEPAMVVDVFTPVREDFRS